jgi:hypothetical protein
MFRKIWPAILARRCFFEFYAETAIALLAPIDIRVIAPFVRQRISKRQLHSAYRHLKGNYF